MTIRQKILDYLADVPWLWLTDLEAKFIIWNAEINKHEINLDFWIALQQLRDEGIVTVESQKEPRSNVYLLKSQVRRMK
jgi:hypothetical protein